MADPLQRRAKLITSKIGFQAFHAQVRQNFLAGAQHAFKRTPGGADHWRSGFDGAGNRRHAGARTRLLHGCRARTGRSERGAGTRHRCGQWPGGSDNCVALRGSCYRKRPEQARHTNGQKSTRNKNANQSGWRDGKETQGFPGVLNGAAGGDRTHDPWLRRPILYPLSYSRNAEKLTLALIQRLRRLAGLAWASKTGHNHGFYQSARTTSGFPWPPL